MPYTDFFNLALVFLTVVNYIYIALQKCLALAITGRYFRILHDKKNGRIIESITKYSH